MKQSKSYPSIDMIQTGLRLKDYIEGSGMSVKDIQELLHLSCPQPIYRWIKGIILPSVDHLLLLSELFGVHMEELLVKRQGVIIPEIHLYDDKPLKNRAKAYLKLINNIA